MPANLWDEIQGDEYLQKHRVGELMDSMVAAITSLKDGKPDSPVQLLEDTFKNWSGRGSSSIPVKPPGAATNPSMRTRNIKDAADKFGDKEVLKKFSRDSKNIASNVRRGLSEGESPWQQNPIYKGMGMEHMLKQASSFKQDFDSLCKALVQKLNDNNIKASFIPAEVKSMKSAQLKTGIKYNGDVCDLSDAVRATICIDIDPKDPEKFAKAYDAKRGFLQKLLQEQEVHQHYGAKFKHFSDRYQNPLGEYRDWLFLVQIRDFVCELQVNFKDVIDRKEDELHLKYEKNRLSSAKLLEAAMQGDAQLVELMIAAGGSVTDKDKLGSTPLHYAARHGSEKMIAALLASGANVLAADSSGRTALYHAVVLRHYNVIQTLVSKMEERAEELLSLPKRTKISLQETHSFAQKMTCRPTDDLNDFVSVASELASLTSAFDRIGKLVEQAFGGLNNTQHALAFIGDARALLKHRNDNNGLTTILSFQAGVNSMCGILDSAIVGGSVAVVEALTGNLEPFHADLFDAARHYINMDKPSSLMALLIAHRNRSLPNNSSVLSDLLLYAIQSNKVKAAKILMEHHAVLTQEHAEQAGWALRIAASANDVDVLKMLLEAGVPPNDQDEEGISALHCAAHGGFVDCLRVLVVEFKADVDILSKKKQSAMLHAVNECQLCAIKFLLDNGASKTKGGLEIFETPATAAIWSRLPTHFLRKMVNLGFDFNDTPYDLVKFATRSDHPEIAKLLKEQGLQQENDYDVDEVFAEVVMQVYPQASTILRHSQGDSDAKVDDIKLQQIVGQIFNHALTSGSKAHAFMILKKDHRSKTIAELILNMITTDSEILDSIKHR